ncbi:MAG TPA: hypothetical protein VHD83_24630 [Puia sp.]|nr:hypothetical protein [Puia sp.]
MKIVLLLLLSFCVVSSPAESLNDIHVKVDAASGDFAVTSAVLGWRFAGSVGQAVHDLRTVDGKDAIGMFKATSFTWKSNNTYIGTIRWYVQRPVVVFSLSLPEGSQHGTVAFPVFKAPPQLPYKFSYHNRIFPLPQFFLEQTSTPWMLFNDSAEACVISPASDFIVSLMTRDSTTAAATIGSGLNPEVQVLPRNFTHSTILVLGKGIRKTWDEWGDALRALYKRERPGNDCDALLNYFGYWTDNGGDYYYNYDTAKGLAGTLLAVKDHYQERGIPLGYMQLDSWWYEKSNFGMDRRRGAPRKNPSLPAGAWNLSGGLMEYKADPFLFPEGLATFQEKLGVPLITHSRWMDPNSDYHKTYKISGFAPIDPAYWEHIMGYLKQSGVTNYEQDWMNYMYTRNADMIADITIGNAFTDGMAQAAQKNGIDLQYCMALPRYFMQGVKYNNLTTARVSGDRFLRKRWVPFIFTSQLAYEMGIWPWSDVFKSPEIDNMIVSVLSAGAVGTGDAIGKEDKANILMACRNDGVLVKPDVPLLPMDQDYLQMARGQKRPVLACTHTQHESITTGYVLAFTDVADTTTGVATIAADAADAASVDAATINNGKDTVVFRRFGFRPGEIVAADRVIVYNPQKNTFRLLAGGETFYDELPEDKYAYYIIAPITSSGIAFLGDAGKIAATGKKRIAGMKTSGKTLKVTVLFAKGESSVMLRGYSEHTVAADKGRVISDASTHLFTLSLSAPEKGNSVTVNLR